MSKFKVGDKVVCIDSDYTDCWLDIGKCYNIKGYANYDDGRHISEVYLEESDLSWMESRFELLEEWEKHQRKAPPEVELQLAQEQIKSLQEKLKEARMLLANVINIEGDDISCSLHNAIEEFLGSE